MPVYESTERHSFISLLQLLLFILGGLAIFTSLAFFIAIAIYGIQSFANLRESGNSTDTIGFLKIVQTGYTIGAYIISALLFAKIISGNIYTYFNLNKRLSVTLILASICIIFSIMPIMEWAISINKQMHFPEFLKSVETWMRNKEDQASAITKEMLVMTGVSGFLVNMMMVAVLPAIGEELTFRGCFQKIFTQWTRNYHWGIWIAAIIFSAIHFQFYGFLPRMFLGALFGYLYVWGRSIWLPVLAHFVTNANTVIIAYIYQLKGQSLDKLDETEPMSAPFYFISLVITVFLLTIIYREYKKDADIITAK